MESKRAKELAEAHWNGYVGPLISVVLTQRDYTHDEVLEMCRYNYISSHIHGFKHGVESERAGEFRPRIGHHPPAHPYYHKDELPLSPEEVKAIVDAIDPPILCASCIRTSTCGMKEAMASSLANGACIQYLPREGDGEGVVDEWEEKDLCRRCEGSCGVAGRERKVIECPDFVPPPSPTSCRDCWSDCGVAGEEREAAECQSHTPMAEGLKLPTITVEGDLAEVDAKYWEEREEWEMSDGMAQLIEGWDVLQVRQTFGERGGDIRNLPDNSERWMAKQYSEDPARVIAAKRAMIVKNAARAMYAPEVCLKIVMSGGKEY